MSIETGISSSPCQLLVVLVWDMAAIPWTFVSLGQTEVYDVNDVLLFT